MAFALHLSSLLIAATGLLAMLFLSPKVPYADPWRFLAHFLSAPWPWNVLDADNGHREVLPNLIRVVELQWLDGNQWLQVVMGALLACTTVAMLIVAIRAEATNVPSKAAAIFFAVVGIFWLGNVRSLAHGNESVHAYLVTLCLVAGTWILADPQSDRSAGRLVATVILGLIATFSFGSGIACFVGYTWVLVLRRARWRSVWIMVGAAGLASLLYIIPGNTGIGSAGGAGPSQLAWQLLRWLCAPFVYIAWPLLDSNVAAQIPLASIRAPSVAVAGAFESLFGPVALARWPNALVGVAGIAWLLLSSHALCRNKNASRVERIGLGIAWFALAVGIMVSFNRSSYFLEHPTQVIAPRYLPWSSLFWSGLAMTAVVRNNHRGATRRIITSLLVAVLILPSQAWMAALGYRTKSTAELTATGIAVGVLDASTDLGENVLAEMMAVRPLVAQQKKTVFSWRETQSIGRTTSGLNHIAVAQIQIEPAVNLFDGDGLEIHFELSYSACPRLILINDQDVVVGMVMREGWGEHWHGWSHGSRDQALRVAAICK